MSLELIFRVTPEQEEEAQASLRDEEPPDSWPTYALEEEDLKFLRICRALLSVLKRHDPELKYFAQAEEADSHHCHVLVTSPKWSSYNIRNSLPSLKEDLNRKLFPGTTRAPEENFDIEPTKNKCRRSGKTVYRFVHKSSYILNYFYSKQTKPAEEEDDAVLWSWTNLPDFEGDCLNLDERLRRHKESQEIRHLEVKQKDEVGDILITKPTPSQKRFMEVLDFLVRKAITTEKQWAAADRDSYLTLVASNSGRGQIKSALEQASRILKETTDAENYLVGETCPTDQEITENRIYKIMQLNGYNPLYVANLMYGWSKHAYGKRNTLWLFGPATTGKTIIAQAIAECVPFYAGVNWTNENFPFCNCPGKMLIWWEEGKMTQKIVETAKCILGGTRVPVDVKCKMAEICEPTPVIITSNTNMCQVYDGNSSSFEHTEPLQERMFRLHLYVKLPPTFGRVTKEEVKAFFKWGKDHPISVEYVFDTPKTTPSQRTIKEVLMPEVSILETDEHVDGPPQKVQKITCDRTIEVNNVISKASVKEIAKTNQCMLHHAFECTECYPELLDDMDKEQ